MKKNVKNLQIYSLNLMRLISLTIVLALIEPQMTNAQAGKTNFSGTWALNTEKSNFGQAQGQGPGGGQRMGMIGGGNFTAKQEANLLTVERTRTGRDGETINTTMKYTLDGKESVNESFGGESKSVATWSADGKTLTIVTTRTFDMGGETREMKTTEEWILTDAKTLSIIRTSTTPGGDRKMTMVYDKE